MDERGPAYAHATPVESRALTDAALDGEIRSALQVDPSPEYLARIRARVADERAAPNWWLSRLWVTGGAALATVAIAVAWWPSVPTVQVQPPLPTAATHVETVPKLAEPPTAALPAWPRRQILRPAESSPRLPEVLFSEDERRALDMVVMLANGGRVEAMPSREPVEEMDVNELAIVPLDIEPLPQLSRFE